MENNFTDERISEMVQAVAGMVTNAAWLLEHREPNSERCNCNAWTPGLCAYHAWAYSELTEAAQRLERVRAYLLKPRDER